ncbi:hypothetical protein HELRODRAFT_185502 [Helobdella robusta]|uniref:Amine oxidase n=1 Tax=Helobdella robusta TaxID=6412 RepID=T1FMW5_HELRO|nr:hypothetical protein HELRODRAFT_185502 [Helobdella robusta]ESO05715.1 hypothetical protein HELRODRAFT_185502 [Helobdella robusta]
MSSEVLDVVVIGAGLSGVAAAHELFHKNAKLRFVILEAKERIGGRTLGTKLRTSSGEDFWDLGGQWIGRCQPHIYSLVEKLQLKMYEQSCSGKKLVQLDSAGSIMQYTSDIPPISLLALLELHCFIWKVSYFIKKMDSKVFMSSGLVAKLDGMTVEQFKRSYFWTQGAKNALDSCCRCIFGSDPVHMSMLYFLMYAHRSNNFEALLSCKKNFGAQELKINGGAWQICHELMKQIPGDTLNTSSPVVSIDQKQDKHVHVRVLNGTVFVCQYVILAIPPNEICKISFNPCLPLQKFNVLQRMPVGCLTKIIVTYAEAFWQKNGFSGEVLTSGANGAHPLCVVFDATSANKNPALVAFVGGTQQIKFSSVQESSRKSLVLETLASFFGAEALHPLDYMEKNWNEEAYNGGCPVNVATPGVCTTLHTALSRPFYRVFFAGTESASRWCGFLNGAVQAGHRAAHEVLYNVSPECVTDKDLVDTCYANEEAQPTNELPNATPFCKLAIITFIAASLLAYKRFFT